MKHRMHHLALGFASLLLAGVCLAAAALGWLRAAAGAVATAALTATMPAAAAAPEPDFWYGTTLAPGETLPEAVAAGLPLGRWCAAPPGGTAAWEWPSAAVTVLAAAEPLAAAAPSRCGSPPSGTAVRRAAPLP